MAAAPAIAEQRHKISAEAAAAQASVPYNPTLSPANRNPVVIGDRIVGMDPDPAIRADMTRQGDPTMQNGS